MTEHLRQFAAEQRGYGSLPPYDRPMRADPPGKDFIGCAIRIGDHLTLKGDKRDPWGIKPPIVVRVLDVKDGWVRYLLAGSDAAMEIVKFLDLYQFETRAAP